MVDRSHIHRERGFRSRLEAEVERALVDLGLSPQYEAETFNYFLRKRYKPDFKIGDLYIEVKGYWPPHERSKFLAVVVSNPDLKIFVALQSPSNRISKRSRTTYSQWCDKHGIPWCPIPIPQEFIQSWVQGERLTFHVRPPTATAATEPLFIQKDVFTAIHAENHLQKTADHGGKE